MCQVLAGGGSRIGPGLKGERIAGAIFGMDLSMLGGL